MKEEMKTTHAQKKKRPKERVKTNSDAADIQGSYSVPQNVLIKKRISAYTANVYGISIIIATLLFLHLVTHHISFL